MYHSETWLSDGWGSAGLSVRLNDLKWTFQLKQFYSSMKEHHSLTYRQGVCDSAMPQFQEPKPDNKRNKDSKEGEMEFRVQQDQGTHLWETGWPH